MPPPESPGYSQASLAHSLVGSLLLSPGSWGTQGFVCALQESVSLVLCKFYNQSPQSLQNHIPWGFSVSLLDSQVGKSFVGPGTFTTVRELLWYTCLIVVQFVSCLLGGSMVGLTHHTFQVCCIQSPCSHGRTLLTYAAIEETQTLKGRCGSVSCGVPGSWCTQGFV